ncbi:MAG: membrane protein insertion efficiency factor YidD [Deltaproteobacteria bacterium]|nr:membrane protein insertion efficiency factor YidD [Deltaproteobacteria bacterium]
MNGLEATPAKPPARRGAFEALYRSYRRATRRQAKATCPYYPTCSAYFILSVREHGPLLGAMYTTDRLLREYPWMELADHYPLVMPHETPRLHDPVPPRRDRRYRKRVRGADP